MSKIEVVRDFKNITNLDELNVLIEKHMEIIGGDGDCKRISNALKNALRESSRSVLFLWFHKNGNMGAFAFSNICSGLETGADYLWINELFVGEEYRKLGIATKIINFIETWGHSNGIKYIACSTGLKNVPAQQLYKKNNYKLHETLWVDKKLG